MSVLQISHYSKDYNGKKAVEDLSLDIQAGEIYGFIGHNGAGKTTTIKAVAGILPHGIFELPALVLSIACGVYLCRNMCRLVTSSPRRVPMVALLGDLLRVLVVLVAPMTVAAAFIECYVTPVIMGLFL